MNKFQALNHFWSIFDLYAYEENSVPTGKTAPAFPYITYEVSTGSFDEDMLLTGSAWYRSTSWKDTVEMIERISNYIGRAGIFIKCEDGAIWIRKGTPFANLTGDPSDDMIKRGIMNIVVQFLTSN